LRREKDRLFEHALGHFLVTNADWVSAPVGEDVVSREILSYALTLEASAREILHGDKSWTKTFLGSPIFPDDPVTRFF
jgi:hypothetical protein